MLYCLDFYCIYLSLFSLILIVLLSGHLIVFPYIPFVLTCYCSNYGHSFCTLLIVVHSIVLCVEQ
jgi:hypothetical protein